MRLSHYTAELSQDCPEKHPAVEKRVVHMAALSLCKLFIREYRPRLRVNGLEGERPQYASISARDLLPGGLTLNLCNSTRWRNR